MTKKPEPVLWLSDARGIYIPRDFATGFDDRAKHISGVADDDWAILEAGPENDLYWDTWSDVEQSATVTDIDGNRFRLHQDGDLWLIPEGMEWDDKGDWFVWPEEEVEEG